MKFIKPTLAAVLLAAATITISAQAQDTDPPSIAARVAFLSGQVSLEAQGADYWSSAPMNYPMVAGDRIYTAPDAHAVLQIGATDLRLWGGTDLTLTNLNEQYQQIGIAAGSVHVRIFAISPDKVVEIDTPNGAVIIQNPGDYRVNVYPDQQSSLVQVNSGLVQITGPGQNQEVDQGEAVQLYGSNPVEIGLIDTMPSDDFDSWSMQRDRHMLNSASAHYVNRYVPGYDDLDDYGSWVPASDYGPIWFPRSTPDGWQPYSTGHWAYVQPWGYTWVDDAPWGYAPFHYGRWVVWQGRWGWVPGPPAVRPIYAPAFVAFVGGGAGVTAWFPLGVAEPFVPWYQCSPSYVRSVNVTNVNISVIHNVTVVNNYNVFINRVSTARSINQIQVNNVTYVNRTHVLAVNSNAMTSGARVQQAVIHLNGEQRQALTRAAVTVARPPVPPPAHPAAGPRARTTVAVARPVLMTTHGRVAATPAANTRRVNPRNLPKPAPATAIRPATRAVVPHARPATAPVHPAPPTKNQPAPANRPASPANRPQPETRPGHPQVRPAPARPANPTRNQAAPANRPAPPANRPQQQTRPEQPQARPAPARPANPTRNQAAPANRPAPPATRPQQQARPAQPQARPAPARPGNPARNQPAPANRPAPPANRPRQQTRPAQPQTRPAPPAKNQSTRPQDNNKKPKNDRTPPQ